MRGTSCFASVRIASRWNVLPADDVNPEPSGRPSQRRSWIRKASSSAAASSSGSRATCDLDVAELGELTATAAVEIARLRGRLRAVDVLPAVGQLEHGRLDALDDLEVRPERRGQSTALRQAVEVDVVDEARGADRPRQLVRELGRLCRIEKQVGESRRRSSEEAADGQS